MTVAAISFQLVVGGRSAAGYSMRATAAGRSAEATLALPPLPDDCDALGLALGRALFPPPIRQLLLDVARGADAAGARVQLQLQLAAPELQAIPWEWATLGSEVPWRPALREDYTLLRVVAAPRPQPALAVLGPLRLLIACAPGATAAAAPLGHALAEPVRAGLLGVDLLRDADPLTLREALAEEPCHALHLVADDALIEGADVRHVVVHDCQHVVTVARRRVRATPREGRCDVDSGVAHQTLPAGHAHDGPALWLNPQRGR